MVSLDAGEPAVLRQQLRRLDPPGALACDGKGFGGRLARSMRVEAVPAYRVVSGDGSVRAVASVAALDAVPKGLSGSERRLTRR